METTASTVDLFESPKYIEWTNRCPLDKNIDEITANDFVQNMEKLAPWMFEYPEGAERINFISFFTDSIKELVKLVGDYYTQLEENQKIEFGNTILDNVERCLESHGLT